MAAKVVSLFTSVFNATDQTQKIERIYFTVVPTGSYAGTPGDTLDLTAFGDLLKSGQLPVFSRIESKNPAGASGYEYRLLPGTTLANGTFQVLQCAGSAAPMADIGAGAYPAGVTGDAIVGYADFPRL